MSGAPTLDPRMFGVARALTAGVDDARLTLARVFDPATVEVGAIEQWDPATPLLVGPAARTLCVAFEVSGPLRARLTLVTTDASAINFGSVLLRRSASTLDRATREALAEVGNILASSFLNGLARLARTKLLPSVPALSEPAPTLLRGLVAPDDGVAFVTPFSVVSGDTVASAVFVATPEEGTVERLLALGRG